MKTSVLVALSLISFASSTVLANTVRSPDEGRPGDYIENSYIVGFKTPANPSEQIIVPPVNKTVPGRKVPRVGEHSTGQSKTELAARLGIHGEIVSIYETINAAHIKMDANEAEKLRQHSLVQNIEQNRVIETQTTQQNRIHFGRSTGWIR